MPPVEYRLRGSLAVAGLHVAANVFVGVWKAARIAARGTRRSCVQVRLSIILRFNAIHAH